MWGLGGDIYASWPYKCWLWEGLGTEFQETDQPEQRHLGERVSGVQEAARRPAGQEWRERERSGRQQEQDVQSCLSVSAGTLASAQSKTGATEEPWRFLSRSRGLLTPRAGLGIKEHPAQFSHDPAFACMPLMMGNSPLCCLWGLLSHE